MLHIPAFCDNCGTVFTSGIVIDNCAHITLSGNKSGPCPLCGSMGTIPDGVFSVAGNVIKLLAGPQKTINQLKKLAEILVEARRSTEEPSKVAEKIKREAPELSSIIDTLPKTRTELYSFLTVIFTAITTIIAVATLYKDHAPSEQDVEKMIGQAIERSFDERRPSEQGSSPVPRRIDPCPCGSGKKYKHCCGELI
jgi:hypothetical protein